MSQDDLPADKAPAANPLDVAGSPSPNVVVRFRVPGPPQQVAVNGVSVKRDAQVVVDTERGPQVGTVRRTGLPEAPVAGKVLRPVGPADITVMQENAARERDAFAFCLARIKALRLPMKLMAVEWAHQGGRAVFHFSSAERVDFRALVKDLARQLNIRIEMRQIGVRDAARHTGGVGICGRSLCCSTWLPEFQPISIRMAKDQNLSLNQQKLSGVCGRLRCCLQYEQSTYHEERKTLPKVGKRVITPRGEGRVRDVNVLRRRVRVDFPDGAFAEFSADEVQRVVVEQQQPAAPPREVRTEPAAQDSAEGGAAVPGSKKRRRRRRRGKGGGDPGGRPEGGPPSTS